jgi:hypothetical protein
LAPDRILPNPTHWIPPGRFPDVNVDIKELPGNRSTGPREARTWVYIFIVQCVGIAPLMRRYYT